MFSVPLLRKDSRLTYASYLDDLLSVLRCMAALITASAPIEFIEALWSIIFLFDPVMRLC